MSLNIPLFDLVLGADEREAISAVLDSGWLTQGDQVAAFETEFAAAHGLPAECAIAVNSGTSALHLGYLAAGVKPGDEVIVPSLTFVATANTVIHCGAQPVFADVISEDDPVLDPRDVERKITDRTRAVCAVHYAGWPAPMAALRDLCRDRGVALIEDAAHAPGGRYRGRAVGTLSDAACFSFFSNKNMTTAEGGMLLVADPDVAASIRPLRSHGMTTSTLDRHRGHAFSYDVRSAGFNYRIDEIRAALGRIQLARLDDSNRRRRVLFTAFAQALEPTGIRPCFALRPPTDLEGATVHILPVVLPEGVRREPFMNLMRESGVQCSFHYPPLHMFTHYAKESPASLPVTESLPDRLVTLPLFPHMTEAQLGAVANAAQAAVSQLRSSSCRR